jgi:hypothetical protein
MHSGQWSASLSVACRCATWTTVSSAIRTRHTTVTTGQEPDLVWSFSRAGVLDPVKQPSLSIKHTQGWTPEAHPGLCPESRIRRLNRQLQPLHFV